MNRGFLDRLTFDPDHGAHMDEARRYMMIRPDALMGIFRRLDPDARGTALEAFGAAIFEQGSDSARAYRAVSGDGAALVRVIQATAPQLGWGVWQMTLSDDRLDLSVRNSPFVAGYGPSDSPVCHAILGMLRAVAGMVLGGQGRIDAAELSCAACGAPLCRFQAWRIGTEVA